MPVKPIQKEINDLKHDSAFELKGSDAAYHSLEMIGQFIVVLGVIIIHAIQKLVSKIGGHAQPKIIDKKEKLEPELLDKQQVVATSNKVINEEKISNSQSVGRPRVSTVAVQKNTDVHEEEVAKQTISAIADLPSKSLGRAKSIISRFKLPQKKDKIPKTEINVSRPSDIFFDESISGNQQLDLVTLFVKRNKVNFKYFFVAVLLLFVLQLITLSVVLFRTSQPIETSIAVEQDSEVLVGFDDDGEPGVRILQDFYVNQGVVDIGFNVQVDSNAISTRDHSNCKTPVPPPEKNGCGFTLIPSALGLPIKGVHYQKIYFELEADPSAKLKLDVKDFERGNLVDDLGLWSNESPEKFVLLPKRLETSEGIRVNFWTQDGGISIKKIKLEYTTIDSLLDVSLQIPESTYNKVPEGAIGLIYEDRDGDRFLSDTIDKPWVCKADFPGVKQVKFDVTRSARLLREDECFTDIIPDEWYTDGGYNSIPAGDWLLVFPNDDITLPFTVESSPQQQEILLLE